MKESVYIIIDMFYAIRGTEKVGAIVSISISPQTYSKRAKFGIVGKEERYSLDELKEELKKYRFKKGDNLLLFVVNVESGKRQDFGINISKKWPDGIVGDTVIKRRESYDITPCLERVCLMCS